MNNDIFFGAVDAVAITLVTVWGFVSATYGTVIDILIVSIVFGAFATVRYWLFFKEIAPPLPWDGKAWKEYND